METEQLLNFSFQQIYQQAVGPYNSGVTEDDERPAGKLYSDQQLYPGCWSPAERLENSASWADYHRPAPSGLRDATDWKSAAMMLTPVSDHLASYSSPRGIGTFHQEEEHRVQDQPAHQSRPFSDGWIAADASGMPSIPYQLDSPCSLSGSELEDNSHQGELTQMAMNSGLYRPLSKWKLKQLRLNQETVVKRRRAANARERKRMNGLNDAFEKLREHVPNVGGEKKLSKMETLQMAQTYIQTLAELMGTGMSNS